MYPSKLVFRRGGVYPRPVFIPYRSGFCPSKSVFRRGGVYPRPVFIPYRSGFCPSKSVFRRGGVYPRPVLVFPIPYRRVKPPETVYNELVANLSTADRNRSPFVSDSSEAVICLLHEVIGLLDNKRD